MFSSTQKDKDNMNTDATNLKQHAREGVSQVKSDIRNATDAIKSDLSAMTDDVAHLANQAGRELRGFVDTASGEVNEAAKVVRTQIRENPMTAGVVTLIAGALLGAFLSRR